MDEVLVELPPGLIRSLAYLGGLKVYCKCPPVLKRPRQGKREEKEKEAQVQKG